MLSVTMPHNDTLMLRGSQLGPYREHEYLEIIKKNVEEGKILPEEEARMINRLLVNHK